MPEPVAPNYEGLIRFLIQPFLESPESLRVDCEVSQNRSRVWVRLAFEGSDKGRVYGRGGRNIQAIKTVLEAVARTAGHSAHLDVYGSASHSRDGSPERGGDAPRESHHSRPSRRPSPRGASR